MDSYKRMLKEIRFKCFEPAPFISAQANRIAELIYDKYADIPQFLWKNFPGYAVFTHKEDQRWYALIMDIDRYKLGLGKGRTEIIDVKADAETIDRLISAKATTKPIIWTKRYGSPQCLTIRCATRI